MLSKYVDFNILQYNFTELLETYENSLCYPKRGGIQFQPFHQQKMFFKQLISQFPLAKLSMFCHYFSYHKSL